MAEIATPEEVDAFLASTPPAQIPLNPDMATPEEVSAWTAEQEKQDKYGGTGSQLGAALEGGLSAATFGLSTGVQTALGFDPKGISGRREINPLSNMGGQAVGLLATGAAGLLERAGVAAAKAVGLGAAETALAKIGSGAVKAAAENAVFQAGDEVSKMFSQDPSVNPSDAMQTAAANIGLSALIGGGVGGGLGAVNPLWKATVGGKVGQVLDSIKRKAGGIDGTIEDSVHDAIQKTGIELAPEIKAGLSNDPEVQTLFKTLQQSDTTKSGVALQSAYQKFQADANDVVLRSFGKTADDLPQEISKYQSGKTIGDTLAKEIDAKVSPIAKEFDALKEKYKSVDLIPDQEIETVSAPSGYNMTGTTEKSVVPGLTSQLSEKIAALAEREGWAALPDSEIMKLANKALKNLPRQKTLKNLSDFTSQLGKEANKDALNFELKRAGQMIKGVLQEGEGDVIMSALGKEGPELVERYTAARSAWRDAAKLTDEIDDRLKIGGSTSSYAKNIRNMAATDGEALLRRISGSGDADMLRVLQQSFPETAEAVRQFHLTDILKRAADKAKPGEPINASALLKNIEKLSPELRDFAIPAAALEKTKAVGAIFEQFAKAPHNFSNTARTMDKLFQYVPATAVGITTLLAGGNPLLAGAFGALTKFMSKDAPDAVKLALLKFMASGQPIEAGAFKATVDAISQTMKGESAVNKAIRGVFTSGKAVATPELQQVAERDREKLDRHVAALSLDPSPLLNSGGEAGYYLPEHASAIAQTAGGAIAYLNSIRPKTDRKSPLDSPIVLSAAQKSAYNRALDLAEKPLLILNDIKNGTLTPTDIVSIKTMYPALYAKLSQKLFTELVNHKAEDNPIPYKTKMAISMFMGQPLDSTMTPESIMAAQPKPGAENGQPGQRPKHSTASLGKAAEMAATPMQRREMKAAQ